MKKRPAPRNTYDPVWPGFVSSDGCSTIASGELGESSIVSKFETRSWVSSNSTGMILEGSVKASRVSSLHIESSAN